MPWASYFHPLDAITGWNRLYGPRGLFQHQSVYPSENAREITIALIECAQKHGAASFLTVLKRFGDTRSPGLMSFPRPGVTLALDFPNRPDVFRLLDRLDEMTREAQGAGAGARRDGASVRAQSVQSPSEPGCPRATPAHSLPVASQRGQRRWQRRLGQWRPS